MTLYLDRKYLQLVSGRLEGFRQKSSNLWNSKCIICHDSKTHKNKKRLYFYSKENNLLAFCHNCGYHSSLKFFLKEVDIALYNQYRMEELESKKQSPITPITKTNIALKFDDSSFANELKQLQKISQLSVNHPAKKYIMERKIPTEMHSVLRWCPGFFKWTNFLVPGKFPNIVLDEGRVIIPFFSKDNKFFAYTGRAIEKSKQRYILIVLDKAVPLLYGLNRVNLNKKVLVVEGPIDSMFLDNCIAMAGSNIGSLTNLGERDIFTLVFDNENHSTETKNKITSTINNGYSVCIWPSWVEYKDINEMIINGWSKEYIQELIRENTFSGLEAKIHLENWSKI